MNKHKDGYVFGMDKEIQNKMQAKFDPEKEVGARRWIEEVLETKMDQETLQLWLKDGTILCQLVNKIAKKKKVKKIHKSGSMAFKEMENIQNYIKCCKRNGMNDGDCFVTKDLYENDNMVSVIDQIYALGSLAKDLGYDGPQLGVKHATENKRQFTEEQIKKGKQIVPLQNAGSIAVEKGKGTDHIVQYGLCGAEMGKASSEATQQSMGSIEVAKGSRTDHIVKYGIVGQEMGKSVGGQSQQNAGSIAVEKSKGTDHIVKYGIVGQKMGESVGGQSQQNSGSIAIEKSKGTDHIVKYGKVGQEMGMSVGGTSQQNEGSLATAKDKKLDSVSRALN